MLRALHPEEVAEHAHAQVSQESIGEGDDGRIPLAVRRDVLRPDAVIGDLLLQQEQEQAAVIILRIIMIFRASFRRVRSGVLPPSSHHSSYHCFENLQTEFVKIALF